MISRGEERAKLCPDEREQLIVQHRPYVRALAIEIARPLPGHIDLEELVACGYLGLVEAAERYDPRYRVSFHTFAWYRIRGAIFDALRQMGPLSRGEYASLRRQSQANDLLQAEAADTVQQSPGSAPSIDDEILRTQQAIDLLIPVYLLSVDDEDGPQIADQSPSTLEQMERQQLMSMARSLVSELADDDRQLIEALYFSNENSVEYARRLGITKSWVSRLHARAIKRLRKLMVDRGLLTPD